MEGPGLKGQGGGHDRDAIRPPICVGARSRSGPAGSSSRHASQTGAQASTDQLEKILSYIDIGKQEGARVVVGGERAELGGDLSGGYYVQPTIFAGDNSMRVFQEEIFGPVVAVTSFGDYADAIKIANDTLYGLGAGVWSRNGTTAYRAGRDLKAGRVWTNCYRLYPAHAAFGGYKQSGIGRENHRMMLDHYQQTKNLLVSYSPKAALEVLVIDKAILITRTSSTAEQPAIDAREATVDDTRVRRVDATDAATAMLRQLAAENGPLMIHQSGGCCDGSSPMCYPRDDFIVGDADVLLGTIDDVEPGGGVPVYIGGAQFEYWSHTHLTIDLVPGRGGGFSLKAPEGYRFLPWRTKARRTAAQRRTILIATLREGARRDDSQKCLRFTEVVPFRRHDDHFCESRTLL